MNLKAYQQYYDSREVKITKQASRNAGLPAYDWPPLNDVTSRQKLSDVEGVFCWHPGLPSANEGERKQKCAIKVCIKS